MDLSDLHKNILNQLSKKGTTGKMMLDSLGMSKNLLSQMKKGEANPTLKTVEAIAEYLDCSSQFLLYGDYINEKTLQDSEMVLLSRYRSLDQDGKNVVQVAALNEVRRMEPDNPMESSKRQHPDSTDTNQLQKMVSPKAPEPPVIDSSGTKHSSIKNSKKNA